MSDAQRLRDRARECRAIALGVRHSVDRQLLEEIAEDLGRAADDLDAKAKSE